MLNDALKAVAAQGDKAGKLAQLKKATDGVEAMFVKDLLSAMRRGTPKSSFGDKGMGSQIYKDMFDQALADSIGQTGSLGISKVLYRQLSKQVLAHVEAAKTVSSGQDARAPEGMKPTSKENKNP